MAAAAPEEMTMREKQKDALLRMLNMNQPPNLKGEYEADSVWKVLIYDAYCRDIISPVLSIGELRKMGVTLHLELHSDRQPVPDVPAVYFIQPTEDNIARVVKDCAAGLYESCTLNFATPVDDALMDRLATLLVESDCVPAVSGVWDHHLNFVMMEKDLVDCKHNNSYYSISAAVSESEMNQYIGTVVDSLFSACVTQGSIPVIRCPRNCAAEMVAVQLDAKLRDAFRSGSALFRDTMQGSVNQRPVLIIVDRNVDLPSMFHHTWTYQPLVHDLLGLARNRVTFTPENGSRTTYDLTDKDEFWASSSRVVFPQISDRIEEMVAAHKELVEHVGRIKGKLEAKEGDNTESVALLGDTRDIAARLPEQTEKKRLIDVHTNVAVALLREIEKRDLDAFFFREEDILVGQKADSKSVMELIEAKGSGEDKLRLAMVYYWCSDSMSSADVDSLEEALTKHGIDTRPMTYLRKIKAFVKTTTRPVKPQAAKSPFEWGNMRDLLDSGKHLFEQAGLKNWLPSNSQIAAARITSSIMDNTPSPETESFRCLDPKSMSAGDASHRTPFREGMVFMVGGGNYVEYHALQEYAETTGKRVVYATTELASPQAFIGQMASLVPAAPAAAPK